MTFIPELDGHRLHLHPERLRLLLAGTICPLTIELGPTSACNHRCTFCAFDYRGEKERLPLDVLIRFFEGIKNLEGNLFHPKSLHLAGDGEPTLYSEFPQVVHLARDAGLSVGVTTNGSGEHSLLRSAPGLAWCRFSVNAGTSDEYMRIHGPLADIEQTFQSIRSCTLMNQHMTVGVQCLILDQTEETLRALYSRCCDSEVDYLAFKHYSNNPQSKNQIQCTAGRFVSKLWTEHYKEKITPQVILREESSPKTYTGCLAAATAFWLICANGEVYPCAQFVGKPEWCLGNIQHQSFNEISHSEKGKMVVRNLRELDCRQCRNPCRCQAANEYLNRLVSPQPHDNFL